MRFGSLFSGIEAASVAWHPLGWEPVFFSEIAKFPSAVLAHHYPNVPNHGDILENRHWPLATLDVLCGGPPCQADSVAGKRGGMADPRGALKKNYLDVVARFKPTWVLFEGVPGVRSVDSGRAFGALVGGLAELGYFGAWASLNAQHFGVAQRRERVFFIGCLRGWERAAAVLFDQASMRGDPAPRRQAGEDITGTLGARTSAGGGLGTDFDCAGGLQTVGALTAACGPRGHGGSGLATDKGAEAGHILAFGGNNTSGPIDVATARTAHGSCRLDFESDTFVTHSLTAAGFDASEDGTGRGTPLGPVAFNLRGRDGGAMPEVDPEGLASMRAASEGSSRSYVCVDTQQITSQQNRSNPQPGDPAPTLAAQSRPVAFQFRQDPACSGDVVSTLDTRADFGVGVGVGVGVRRLTPRECERLQGFPDDYTLIPYRGKMAADGPRYSSLGNSWAVPVVRWIGERMQAVQDADA